MSRQVTHCLSPVIRGEGWGEGSRSFRRSAAVDSSRALNPSPPPSARCTGEREWPFWLIAIVSLSIVLQAIADDLPQFIVPRHEKEMTTLRELFALHVPRAAPAATLWDQWMTESSLWCKGGDIRQKWFDALSH